VECEFRGRVVVYTKVVEVNNSTRQLSDIGMDDYPQVSVLKRKENMSVPPRCQGMI
jgi:hypothetical protein